MKKYMMFSIFFLYNISSAQLSVSVLAGFDPIEVSLYNSTALDGENAYWNNGITFGLNCDYSLSEEFSVSALFHYTHYKFNNYANAGISYPEIRFISATAQDSKLWRTSVETKYFSSPNNRFSFFIFSGLGVIVEDLGTVKTQFSDMNIDGNITYIINSEINNYFVHSLGLGVRTEITSNLFVDISGLYYSNYSDRFQTFFGANIGYKIL